jgi:hypothetical protein
MTFFNLFALTNDPESRILRFALSQEVQEELTAYIKEQEASFNSYAQQEFIFDGKYKPDDGECLIINNYDDIDDLSQAIANPLSVPEINPDPATFASIKALFTGYTGADGNKSVLIQHFDRRKILSTRGLSIFHSANVYKKVDGIGITIDSKLSAIISGTTLKFFSFHVARQIFDLSQYYIEATDNDINEFAAIAAVQIPEIGRFIEVSDSWIRRKLALIKQSGILETVPISVIKAVAAEFNIELMTTKNGEDEIIILPEKRAEIKKILRLLDEDYYKSPLSSKNYITNSKRLAQ